MTIYLGPVGNLQALPSIGRGIGASLDLGAAVHRSLTGVRTVDYAGLPKRTYTMERRLLTDAEVGIIEGLALGAYGPGPYALLDPWRENLLTANQSTGTDALGDTTGFRVGTSVGGSIVSTETAKVLYGSRSVGWYVSAVGHELFVSTATPGGCDLATDVPVAGGQFIRFSGWAITQTSQVDVLPMLRFYDRLGNMILSVQGARFVGGPAIWSQWGVFATAPENAAVCVPFVGTDYMDASQKVYLDGLSLSVVQGAENLFPNGNFEEAQDVTQGYTDLRINEATNPYLAVNTTGWDVDQGTGGTASLSRQTGQGWWYATTSARATWTVGTSAVSGGLLLCRHYESAMAGRKWSHHVQARPSKQQRLCVQINWYDGSDVYLTSTFSTEQVIAAAAIGSFTGVHTAPANAARMDVYIKSIPGTSATNWNAGDWLEATHAHVEESDLDIWPGSSEPVYGAPFSADMSAGTYSPDAWYRWEGTAHASRSIMLHPFLPGSHWGGGVWPRIAQTSERANSGQHSALVRWPTTGAGNSVAMWRVAGMETWVPYILAMTVYVPTGSPDVLLWDSDGSYHYGAAVATAKDQWVRIFTTIYSGGATSVGLGCNAASVMGGDRVYVDDVQVIRRPTGMTEDGAPLSMSEAHVPGTGVPRVAFTELSDTYPIIGAHDVSFTLVEVQ